MKKLLTIFTLLFMAVTSQAQTYHLDTNNDGETNLTDALIIIDYILGKFNPKDAQQPQLYLTSQANNYHLDANNNGEINLTDALIIIDYILGKFNPEEGQHQSYLTCPDDHHPHLIDLGLPSGTKWACCNVGADNPEAYGEYYTWGETDTKSIYDWNTYIYSEESETTCHDLGSDIAGTTYDVAHVKWSASWVMPSKEQIDELINNCTSTWTTQNGVEGRLFTGTTSGSIFLPAAGTRVNSDLYDAGSCGNYWSSMENPSYAGNAYCLYFHSNITYCGNDYRSYGHSVRPVVTGTFIPHLKLFDSDLDLVPGMVFVVKIGSGSGRYSVESGDENVATVRIDGNSVIITAIGVGSTIITVTDSKSSETAPIEVRVSADQTASLCPDDHHPHLIDLGLPSGTKWACCNVDTDHPENQSPTNYGGYYAWGETETKNNYDWSTYIHCDGTQETCHFLGENISGTENDVAHVKWGGDWMMPTESQFRELSDNCTYQWTTLNGIRGRKITSKNNGGCIFIPAAGRSVNTGQESIGDKGYYWTSTHNTHYVAQSYYFNFTPESMIWGQVLNYSNGLSIRPVYSPSTSLYLSEDTVDMFVNSTTTVSIESGSGEYELQNGNPDIVDAELILADKNENPDAKDEIFIYGIAEGMATLNVLDKTNNKTISLVVNVKTPTAEDVAVTRDYIQRVRDYINIQDELEVKTFQSNLLTWLEAQSWVKKVNVYYDNDIVSDLSQNKPKRFRQELKEGASLIEIIFKNIANFSILFYDSYLDDVDDVNYVDRNWIFPSYSHRNISGDKNDPIIENSNVLYIIGRTMPSFKDQYNSTVNKETEMIGHYTSLSPVDFKLKPIMHSLSFLSEHFPNYGMVLLGQTHGTKRDDVPINYNMIGKTYGIDGAFQVEDESDIICGFGLTIPVKDKTIIESKKEPIIYWVYPGEMSKHNIKERTIFFANYCYSYCLEQYIPQTTFFGYNSKSGYPIGSKRMVEFFYNMSLGMTYNEAIESIIKPYSYINQDHKKVNALPITNDFNSKQRYFSIFTDDVTEYTEKGPVVTGRINGYEYKNLKPGIDYFVYAFRKGEEFENLKYEDITKGLKNGTIQKIAKIEDDGTFRHEYTGLLTELNEKYQVVVCFCYEGIIYHGKTIDVDYCPAHITKVECTSASYITDDDNASYPNRLYFDVTANLEEFDGINEWGIYFISDDGDYYSFPFDKISNIQTKSLVYSGDGSEMSINYSSFVVEHDDQVGVYVKKTDSKTGKQYTIYGSMYDYTLLYDTKPSITMSNPIITSTEIIGSKIITDEGGNKVVVKQYKTICSSNFSIKGVYWIDKVINGVSGDGWSITEDTGWFPNNDQEYEDTWFSTYWDDTNTLNHSNWKTMYIRNSSQTIKSNYLNWSGNKTITNVWTSSAPAYAPKRTKSMLSLKGESINFVEELQHTEKNKHIEKSSIIIVPFNGGFISSF